MPQPVSAIHARPLHSRDARRPSTLPLGLSGGPSGQFRHRTRESRGVGSTAGGDVPVSEQSSDGLSPLRPSRLSRSYVTLLAAAAEEARAMTPGGAAGSGRIPGQAAHAIPRTDSSVSTSVINAMAGGGVCSEIGEVSGRDGLRLGFCQIRLCFCRWCGVAESCSNVSRQLSSFRRGVGPRWVGRDSALKAGSRYNSGRLLK